MAQQLSLAFTFNVGPEQAGVTANEFHNILLAGEHVAHLAAKLLTEGVQVVQPTDDAVEEWGKQIEVGNDTKQEFYRGCTPGYFNKDGKPEDIPARWGFYPKGIVE